MSSADCPRTPLAPIASSLAPRFIRLRDAPRYLGMDKNRFNRHVRPQLTNIPIGIQGVAFDRLELDAWGRTMSRATGAAWLHPKGASHGNVNRPASPCVVRSGTST